MKWWLNVLFVVLVLVSGCQTESQNNYENDIAEKEQVECIATGDINYLCSPTGEILQVPSHANCGQLNDVAKLTGAGWTRCVDSQLTSETPEPINYLVTRVIDGDTIVLNTGETVRLIGINTPERGEDCYEEARSLLEDLVLGKEVTLEADEVDKDVYGRLLRYVFEDGHNVNYGMLYLGFAYKYEVGSNTEYSEWFKEAELNASSLKRGCLWLEHDDSEPICSSNYYNCADFNTQAEAQAVMQFCGPGDIHYLDGDDDGLACESLP